MDKNKNLCIIRHGKSSWDLEGVSDIDRPLNARGINNSYLMARKLSERKFVPELLITSPASRALYTAVIFSRVLKVPYSRINIEDKIYMGYMEDVIELIRNTDNGISNILIFGHNPGFTTLANKLLNNAVDNIPTSGIVGLSYSTDNWQEIGNVFPVDEFFDYPKKYVE